MKIAPFLLGGRDGFTHFPPTVKTPFVGESAALLRFHGLDQTGVLSLQKNTGAVPLIDDREVFPVRAQPGVILNESQLIDPQMIGYRFHLLFLQDNITGPAAAVAAALAEIGDVV